MSLLHYITYKLVVIKDRRLGSIYYIITVLIVLYTLAEIFVKKGYLEFDISPQATMRVQLSDPEEDTITYGRALHDNLAYCCTSGMSRPSKMCTKCKTMDARELSWPVESGAISLTTFAKDRWQVKHISTEQQQFRTIRETMYFTADPETMVVKIEHAVVSTKFSRGGGGYNMAASERNMKGHLYSHNGTTLKSLSSNEITDRKGQADKFSIQELLQAAGVQSLDEPSDALNAKGKPFRRHGIVLHVVINYKNTESTWLGTGDIEYSYHVKRIPYADYRVNQVIPVLDVAGFLNSSHTPRQENRLFRKRYGIKIEFHQGGSLEQYIVLKSPSQPFLGSSGNAEVTNLKTAAKKSNCPGHFSLPALLLQLASGVGLLTLTATVVDILTLYILPDKISYRRFVYEESPSMEKNKIE